MQQLLGNLPSEQYWVKWPGQPCEKMLAQLHAKQVFRRLRAHHHIRPKVPT